MRITLAHFVSRSADRMVIVNTGQNLTCDRVEKYFVLVLNIISDKRIPKMSEKQQFDEFLGGKEKLPRDAHVIKLATARASEMAAMTFSLGMCVFKWI